MLARPISGWSCGFFCLWLFFFLAPHSGMAQEEYDSFQGYVNIRYRYEFQHNFNIKYYGKNPLKGEGSDGFLLQRVRAGGRWALAPNVHVAVGTQDASMHQRLAPRYRSTSWRGTAISGPEILSKTLRITTRRTGFLPRWSALMCFDLNALYSSCSTHYRYTCCAGRVDEHSV